MKPAQSIVFTYLQEAAAAERYSAQTLAMHKSHLRSLCEFIDSNLLELSNSDIQDWVNHSLDKYEDSDTGRSTVLYKFLGVRAFYKFMVQSGRLVQNPCEGIVLPKATIPDLITLNEYECEELMRAPRRSSKNGDSSNYQAHLDSAILSLLYGCGLRPSECLNLAIHDVSKNSYGLITRLKIRSKHHASRELFPEGKVSSRLSDYLKVRPDARSRRFLVGSNGAILKNDYLQTIVTLYVHDQNLNPLVTPHKLRHSFALSKANSGTSAEDLQQVLGNRSIEPLRRYYSSTRSSKRRAMSRIKMPL